LVQFSRNWADHFWSNLSCMRKCRNWTDNLILLSIIPYHTTQTLPRAPWTIECTRIMQHVVEQFRLSDCNLRAIAFLLIISRCKSVPNFRNILTNGCVWEGCTLSVLILGCIFPVPRLLKFPETRHV